MCYDRGPTVLQPVELQTFFWKVELLDGASYNSNGDGSGTSTATTSTFFAVLPWAWEGKLRWENRFRWGKKIRPERLDRAKPTTSCGRRHRSCCMRGVGQKCRRRVRRPATRMAGEGDNRRRGGPATMATSKSVRPARCGIKRLYAESIVGACVDETTAVSNGYTCTNRMVAGGRSAGAYHPPSYTSPNSPLPGRGPRSLSRHGNQVSSADPEETDGELPTATPDRFPVCIRSSSCAVCRGPFAKAMFEFLNCIRMHQGDKNGKNSELKYDAQCGMSKGVFEWQCRQFEKVSSRTPELMRKMRANAQKMRVHFKDTEDLKTWDAYERNVLYACEHYLKTSLATPAVTPIGFLVCHGDELELDGKKQVEGGRPKWKRRGKRGEDG
ncbi:uncharacterized protein [Triticum aestivum]|uniref:uncharacterized protein isoform X3 n=1 Tax=Triticum aestivum TaxID=4565 RepID=UPI001D033ADB|nr:uncharacterized protein LOC123119977 isoform X3 [Triticum aestivum]